MIAPPDLLSALDRRLQVDRVLALEPLRAGLETPARRDVGSSQAAPPVVSSRDPGSDAGPLARLPLGQIVTARVVGVPAPDHVVADIGDLRIAMAWPSGSGVAPTAGRDVSLRVLAHRPILLFQSVATEADHATEPTGDGDAHTQGQVRWSSDALRLQGAGSSTDAARTASGALRFDVPILEIEVELLRPDATKDRDPSTAASLAGTRVATDASTIATTLLPPVAADPELHRSIALDDIIVARSTALIDGVETPLISRLPDDAGPTALPFMPLVLQGPAWPGQEVELVIRREREDEQFDNPVLDHWCGEVVIDLPRLGRVAGHLAFSMQGLRLRIEGDDESGVVAMSAASAELAAALADADLRVAGLTVGRPSADTTRPEPRVDDIGTTCGSRRHA